MHTSRRWAGFTLIEVMITVAIVAILASIAFASYRNQVVRSNRSAAQSFMLEVASRQERYLLDNRSYAADLTALGMTAPPEVSRNYTVTVGPLAGATEPTYIVEAEPTGAQATDDTDCGTLTLNQLGTKAASGGGARCWQ